MDEINKDDTSWMNFFTLRFHEFSWMDFHSIQLLQYHIIHENTYKENMEFELKTFQFVLGAFIQVLMQVSSSNKFSWYLC